MIYLDNAATTKPMQFFIDNCSDFLENKWFNPSAIYKDAVDTKSIVENTRELAQRSLGNKYNCYFSSCGTEGANLAIFGSLPKDVKGLRVITSATEHPCVYECFKELEGRGADVQYVNTDEYGVVDFEDFKHKLTPKTAFISIMHVNNITGGVNDINTLYEYSKNVCPDAVFHSDGVQGYLKTKTIPKCHIYTASGHKINALKGIGLIFVRKGFKFGGKLYGGGQEKGLRSGTENTLGIYSLNFAIDFWMHNLDDNLRHMSGLQKVFLEEISRLDGVVLNSCPGGSSHIINISFIGMGGEILLHSLEGEGIYVSTGSACSSRKKDPRLSNALGYDKSRAESQLRLSFTHDTTKDEVIYAANRIVDICNNHRILMRRKGR